MGRSFEAMLYFLYSGEIMFAPFSSDPRQELSAQTRTGDWTTGRLPSPSAKSIYRPADKVTRLSCIPRPRLISCSTIYRPSSNELWHTSTTTWHTATLWRRYFPVSHHRELLPGLNYHRVLIVVTQLPGGTVDASLATRWQIG